MPDVSIRFGPLRQPSFGQQIALKRGLHMYIHDGSKRVVDDTYSDDTYADVYLNGERLSRAELVERMIGRTII
jgi:hypothetical protein